MSLISLSQRYVALAIGKTLHVFCRNTGKLLFKYECDGKDINEFDATYNEKKEAKNTNTNTAKTEQKCNAKKPKTVPVFTDKCVVIHQIVYSSKHDCFIIVTDDKHIRCLMHKDQIQLRRKDEDQDMDLSTHSQALYQLHRYRKLDKKISSMCLSPLLHHDDEEYLLSADKFGVIRIHYLPALNVKYDGAGHLTIISHIAFDSSGKYLMSADKDFKIRISRFPQIYIIDGFCYGHTQAVTKCVIIDHKRSTATDIDNDVEMKNDPVNTNALQVTKYVVSGSIDGTVRFFEIPSGKQLSICEFKAKGDEGFKQKEEDSTVFEIGCDLDGLNDPNEYNALIKDQRLIVTDIKYAEKTGVVAVSFNRSSEIYLFGLDCGDTLKPNLKLLGSLKSVMDCTVFNGLYDMRFDENGNLMTLVCCKENKTVYLSLDVLVITKQGDSTVSVQSAKDDIVIQMIQKQTKEISGKMENVQMVPAFAGLLRNWELTTERQKHYKTKEVETTKQKPSDPDLTEPPMKKQKLSETAQSIDS